jgi:hypothetical protein
MNHSESIKELAAALSKAQAQIKPAVFDSKNPHFKNEYASLSSYIDASRKALTDNALSLSQTIRITERGNILVTTLMHASGEWISGEMPLIVGKGDMQGLGSAITYARRYGFAAIVGMTQDDDDGNGASVPAPLANGNAARLEPILKSFASLGVSRAEIQNYYALDNLEGLSNAEITKLIELGKKIRSGEVKKEDVFV